MCNCDCSLDKRDRWEIERAVAALQIANWVDRKFTGTYDLPARIAAEMIRNGDWDED